jgi:predicted PurR-regulated permease PerM
MEQVQRWGNTTKLFVSLMIFAIIAWLLIRFQYFVGPLVMAVLLAYLFYPLANWVRKVTHISWRVTVSIIFLLLILILLGLTTLGGIALIEQSQSLIGFLQGALRDLPDFINTISSKTYEIGPFAFKLNLADFNTISQTFLGVVQPLLSRTGAILGSLATGTASFIGWISFILLVAYFILAESGGYSGQLIRLSIPGYNEDLRKFSTYLSGIWNSFLRGQLTIILITILVYMVLLGILGLRFFLGLAFLAGLARFVPYVGPVVAWTTYGLVAFFQGATLFGLAPIWYVVLVVGSAWLMDFFLDNFVGARLMGSALKIHPAIVMVSALIGANILGLAGVVLAGPVVASLKLLFGYVFNRLIDRDPWEVLKANPPPVAKPIAHIFLGPLNRVIALYHDLRPKLQKLYNQRRYYARSNGTKN